MRKYRTDCGRRLSGVPRKPRSRSSALRSPITLITSPIASIRTIDVAAYRRSSCIRPAPKYCEMRTPAPMEKPSASAVNRIVSEVHAPTEESACCPSKLPTMMVSAVL